MDEQPTAGSHDEAPPPPPPPPVDGVVLFDPRPKEPLPIEESPTPEPPRRKWIPIAAAVGVLALIGGSLAVFGLLGRNAEDSELPPMIPSMLPGGGGRAALTAIGDFETTAPVGTEVPIGVRATSASGLPMVDTLVVFRVEAGSGALVDESIRTDSDGVASTTVLLAARPDTTLIVSEIQGASLAPLEIRIAGVPDAPRTIEPIGGNGQEVEVGQLLPDRVTVRVTDTHGNPVPGVQVNFRVRTGGGMTAPSQTRTDSAGVASALWRLGMADGEQELAVTSPALPETVTFSAEATPGESRVDPDRSTGAATGPVTVRAQGYVIGGSHVCRLLAGQPRCRGGNDRGQAGATSSVTLIALASGASHVCGLDSAGAAYCWGANESGQVGDGTTVDRSEPVPVRTELRFGAITAGVAHTCGLAGGGIPACWGNNLNGQLGDGSRTDQRGPRTVGGGLAFRSLTAGWNHTCGLTASGNAFCWGLNSQGQLGDGSRLDRLAPTLVRGAVENLVAGSSHTCGTSEGRVLCWGGNAFGQLGDGTTEDRLQPTEVQGLPSAPTVLAAGAVHTCALVSGGEAYCWGQNLQGQLGDGTNENRTRAVPVSGGLRFSALFAGGAVTCGRTTIGQEYCWGFNGSGQIGDGTRVSRNTPTRVGS